MEEGILTADVVRVRIVQPIEQRVLVDAGSVRVDQLGRVRGDGVGIARQKILAFAHADKQRRTPPGPDDNVRGVRANDGNAVGADDFLERVHHGAGQRRRARWILAGSGGLDLRVMVAD